MNSNPSFDDRRLRLRAILSAQFTVILAVCVLAAVVGAGLVFTTHISPGTETETQTTNLLTIETEHSHSAVVTEPNPVFSTGTVLDDRNTYFTQISPVLDVDVETAYRAPATDSIDMTVDSVLIIRNVENGFVHWDRQERLTTEDRTTVGSGETVERSFRFDSSELAETADAIENAVGDSPGETETVVATTIDVDGTVGGEPVSHTQTVEMDIQHDGDTYTVSNPGVTAEPVERTEQVTVDRTYGPLRSIGGPLLFGLGVAGVAGLSYARQHFELELTAAEAEYLSYRDDRSEFDEWITQIRLPPSVHERETATATTLADLVDHAIDSETGVVFDPETGSYHAVSTEYIFTYHPPRDSEPAAVGSNTDTAPTEQTNNQSSTNTTDQKRNQQSDASDT